VQPRERPAQRLILRQARPRAREKIQALGHHRVQRFLVLTRRPALRGVERRRVQRVQLLLLLFRLHVGCDGDGLFFFVALVVLRHDVVFLVPRGRFFRGWLL